MEEGKEMKTNPDLILREIYGRAILMPARHNDASDEPIYLNDVAAKIWKETSFCENVNALKKSICEEYGLGESSAEAYSIQNFITQLIDKKLIYE